MNTAVADASLVVVFFASYYMPVLHDILVLQLDNFTDSTTRLKNFFVLGPHLQLRTFDGLMVNSSVLIIVANALAFAWDRVPIAVSNVMMGLWFLIQRVAELTITVAVYRNNAARKCKVVLSRLFLIDSWLSSLSTWTLCDEFPSGYCTEPAQLPHSWDLLHSHNVTYSISKQNRFYYALL